MYLQLNTRFNPFTYDEMVKPLLYYKEAYDKAEAAYDTLAQQTEMWRDIANREKSPEAFAMFQRYSNDLANAALSFSQGMTSQNRRALLGLKRRYASDIIPIAKASEAMEAANELRTKAGPDAIFEVENYDSIDPFLHGKTANNRYQSRNELIKETATITEAVMAEAIRDPEFRKAMGDQFWEIIQHTGGSYKDLIEAIKLGIMDNPIAQNRFSQIRQSMLKKAGIERYGAAGQRAIANAIDLGMYAGLDKPSIQFQANQGYLNPLQQTQLRQMRSTSSSSSSKKEKNNKNSNSSNEDNEETESAYLAGDVIYEQDENGKWSVVHDMDPSDKHGYRTNGFLNMKPEAINQATLHIEGSDPNLYEFYTWVTSDTGRSRLQINRKQSSIKPVPTRKSVVEDNSY